MNAHASRRGFLQSLGLAAALPRWAAAAPETGTPIVRLSNNESPYGPFPSVVSAMAKAGERGNYYVTTEAAALQAKLAERNGVSPASVLLGVGSTEPLRAAVQVFSSAAHPPVAAEPTYETVASAAGLAGIEVVKVPVNERGGHDVRRMVEAARQADAGLLYLCNPNNPTGAITSRQELDWLMENLPPGILLLADEAYIDFVDDPQFQSALAYLKRGRQVVIVRTFSKIHGMAGMRMGYALGPEELLARMRPRMLGRMGLNHAGVAGALAGLDDQAAYERVRAETLRVRRWFTEKLSKLGYQCFDSQANFLMIDVRRPVEPVAAKLFEAGFGVGRLFPSMPSHLRVSLGTMADMERFLPALEGILTAA